MVRVKGRYMNGSEVVLEDCNTVNAIKVKFASKHDVFAPDVVILSIDASTPFAGSDEAPAHVQVVINKPVDPCNDAHRWQSALLVHATTQDMAGVHRAMTSIDQDVQGAAKTKIYTKALWYYFRDIFGPCDSESHYDLEHDDMSTAPNQRGALDLDWVQTLIGCRADIEFHNPDCCHHTGGYPPLTLAAKNGHVDACQMLLAAGAEVDGMYLEKAHLMLAAENGHLELCRILVSAGAYIGGQYEETSLEYLARTSGNAEACKLLLTLDAVQSVRKLSSDQRQEWLTAASHPASNDSCEPDPSQPVDLSKVLLPADCDLASCDDDEKTLLAESVRRFVNVRSSFDIGPDTVIAIAASFGYADMCRVCIAAGADVHFRNMEGFAPLDFASTDGVRELLISAGAKPSRGYWGGWD
eukprot:GEMP01046004.1.p1 GENE.GEMP01046004.1~~GEMP01046004.1.p1  ORF type:complete len:434 (+),score=84.71 GEMP01046004.1:68-1303(+)